MKKFISIILIMIMATFCMFCFTGCKDGKCDDCGTREDVCSFEKRNGDEVEYCPECYLINLGKGILGGLLG